MSSLLRKRIAELKRDLIPDSTEPADIVHNMMVQEYIDLYQDIIDKSKTPSEALHQATLIEKETA